jgi:hypothetical protein
MVHALLDVVHNHMAKENYNPGINGVHTKRLVWPDRAKTLLSPPLPPPTTPIYSYMESLLLELIAPCLAEHQLRKWIRSVLYAAHSFLLVLLPGLANRGPRVA